MSSKASVFYSKGELIKAIEIWEVVLQQAEELEDKRAINPTLNNLGVAYYAQGKFKKAEAAYERALNISETIGDTHNITRTSTNLAVIYYKRGDFKKAIKLFNRGLTISEETGDKQGMAVIGANLGIVHCDAGEYDKARDLFQKQLEISKTLGHTEGILYASKNLGQFHTYRGEYDKAMPHYKRAIKSAEALNNKHSIGEYTYYLGSIYLLNNDLENAKQNLAKADCILEEALSISKNKEEGLNTIIALAATKITLAQLSERVKKQELLKDATMHAEKAWALSKELDMEMPMARSQIAISRSYALQSELERSEEHFAKGVKMLKDLHQKRIVAHSFFEQARILGTLPPGVPDAKKLAKKYAKAAKELYNELGLHQRMKECDDL